MLLATAVLVGSGCGSSDDGSSSADAKGTPGGTLTFATAFPIEGLDGHQYQGNNFDVIDQIYEPLVRYSGDGEITPGLATRWTVSPDGKTLTFTLRDGVTFSDGTPLDSEVVKSDFERWIGLTDHSFLGINGAKPSAPDPKTFVLTLPKPCYPALYELTFTRPLRIMSPTSFDSKGKFVKPIGTGPYKYLSQTPEKEMVLTRNDAYWGPKATLDKLVFKTIPDDQARITALQAGEIEVIGGKDLAPMAPESVNALKGDDAIKVLTEPSTVNILLGFNTDSNKTLRDVDVRHAINLAIDRDGLSKTLFAGLAPPANAEFPPNVPYGADANATKREFDPAEAMRLLVGKQDLHFELIINPAEFPEIKGVAEALQAQFKDVGIDLEVTPVEATGYNDRVVKGQYDIAVFPSYGARYDPYSTMLGAYTSDPDTGGHGKAFTSPVLDKLVTAMLETIDEDRRAARYEEIFDYLREQWGTAPMIQKERIWAVRSNVKGFEPGPTDYHLPLAGVTVKP
ncbi:MAG TPA: ABC transporter substrate-binding protein [Solirubrobacteraceae bacterium]|nr:ABC transporter substrate-binding protein [Solirubrobacteraceae bacterium]